MGHDIFRVPRKRSTQREREKREVVLHDIPTRGTKILGSNENERDCEGTPRNYVVLHDIPVLPHDILRTEIRAINFVPHDFLTKISVPHDIQR